LPGATGNRIGQQSGNKVTIKKAIGQQIKEERFLRNAALTSVTEEKEVRLLSDTEF